MGMIRVYIMTGPESLWQKFEGTVTNIDKSASRV
jgi:hypothetical protein